jgi:hypothetical protein
VPVPGRLHKFIGLEYGCGDPDSAYQLRVYGGQDSMWPGEHVGLNQTPNPVKPVQHVKMSSRRSPTGSLPFSARSSSLSRAFLHDFSQLPRKDSVKISRFVHLDFVLEHFGQPRSRTRPDFLGLRGGRSAIAVEAKGRSRGCDDELVEKAKNQVRSLPSIKGHSPSVAYAHVAYFEGDMWCAYLEDPPRQSVGQVIDPAALTLAYYLPVVNAIQRGQATPERVRIWDEVTYLRRSFDEVDCSILVREDIARLVPTESTASPEAEFGASGARLYDHVLALDEEPSEEKGLLQDYDSDMSFLGSDGIGVQPGPTWANWPAGT